MSTDETTPLPVNNEHQGSFQGNTCDTLGNSGEHTGNCHTQDAHHGQASENTQPYATESPYSAPGTYEAPYAGDNSAHAYAAPATSWQAPQGAFYTHPLVESLRTNSTLCLILGVLTFLGFGLLTSIPAWVWGNSILNKAKLNGVDESVVSNAKIGKVLGIIGTIASTAVVFLIILFLFFFAFAIVATPTMYPFTY